MRTEPVQQARRYIAKMPPSIQDQQGSSAMFKVAVVLKKKFDLPDDVAMALMREWNAVYAAPPWSEGELRHKLDSAGGHKAVDSPAHNVRFHTPKADGSASFMDQSRDSLRQVLRSREGVQPSTSDRKAALRADWPKFYKMNELEMEALANMREIPVKVVHQACSLGLLSMATVQSYRCYVIYEDDFAQARRLDGGKLEVDGKLTKSKNLPGSLSSFIGRRLLGVHPTPILLVEGCVGILEGLAAIYFADAVVPPRDWTILAATSASSRFDDAWLQRLAGRRVRIVPDAGAAGMDFCAKATASLRSAKCTVDAVRLPSGIGDIGPIVASPHQHESFFQAIFDL